MGSNRVLIARSCVVLQLVLIFQFEQILRLTSGPTQTQTQQRIIHIQDVACAAKINSTSESSASSESSSTSMLSREVESIYHIPEYRQVIVNLQQRSCRNPKLFGRLSGPYVTLIDWEAETQTRDDDVVNDNASNYDHSQTAKATPTPARLVGTYPVLPDPGKYFIEVIGLFCNGPQWNATFQYDCMEDPTTHRLTDDTAFIEVIDTTNEKANEHEIAARDRNMAGQYGYWKWSGIDNGNDNDNDNGNNDKKNEDYKNETTAAAAAPLLTRYQPQQCHTEADLESDRCQVAMSREQFAPYQFITIDDNDNNNMSINNSESRIQSHLAKLKREEQPNSTSTSPSMLLCFIGLSHAREMSREVNLWLNKWNADATQQSSIVVKSISIDAQFPRLVNPNSIQSKGCNATVIAAGQWSAGRKPPGGRYRGLPPTTFDDYQIEMREMILKLKDHFDDDDDEDRSSHKHKIYLRSIHYNALGDVKTKCPPEDWRSPPVIDTYNEIVKNLSSSMNISFIDTNFIVGPLWDISKDFCHYRSDKVASAEALYMLERLLLPPALARA